MLTLTERLHPDPDAAVAHTLALTAEERTRSRYRFSADDGAALALALPRGTVLRDGDLLSDTMAERKVRIRARAEPVMTARATDRLMLLRAAYHLGNRHVPIEVRADFLRLSPDAVLKEMLEQLGLDVMTEIAPFQPEPGAYGGHHHGDSRVPYRQLP